MVDKVAKRAELDNLIQKSLIWKESTRSMTKVKNDNGEQGLKDKAEPFPLDTLPKTAKRYVREGAKALKCDPTFIAVPLLPVLASAIGDSCEVKLSSAWKEPAIIWASIIAPSGSLKTPAMKLAIDLIQPMIKIAIKEYKEAKEEYEMQMLDYEVDFKQWQRKGRDKGDPRPEKPEVPICMRYLTSDATMESLVDRLDQNPQGLLLYVDELTAWFGNFNAYRAASNKDEPAWLSIHSGSSITVDRKTGKQFYYIEKPIVSIIGGIQPMIFSRLFGSTAGAKYAESGLMARMLLCQPPLVAKKWSEDTIAEATKQQMLTLVEDLFDIHPDIDNEGNSKSIEVTLDSEAKKLWRKFYNEHAKETHKADGAIRAHWSKLEAYAARLALLIHIARYADGEPVELNLLDAQSMASGIRLARWFGGEAKRIYANLLKAEGEVDTELRDLSDWISQKGGRVTVRDVQQGHRRYKTSNEAEAVLIHLKEAGLGNWELVEADKSSKATRYFVLSTPSTVYGTGKTPEENAVGVDAANLIMKLDNETGDLETDGEGVLIS